MLQLQQQIKSELDRLRAEMDIDFAALAWTDADEHVTRWRSASGNRNDRYKRIVLRPGKGFDGKVMRSARPLTMKISAPTHGDDPRDYAILLAEGLKSFITVPIQWLTRVLGVLLIGCRSDRAFTPREVEFVQERAQVFAALLPK